MNNLNKILKLNRNQFSFFKNKKIFNFNYNNSLFQLNKFYFGAGEHAHNPETVANKHKVDAHKDDKHGHGGHDDHGHSHEEVQDYHQRKFNRVSYNAKLTPKERDHIPIIDDKDQSADSINRFGLYEDNIKMNVLIPYDKYKDELIAERLMDRTEIQARIFNILRQFDFLDLDSIDLEGDYEKDLKLDSLDWTALITSIEYEFHTAFPDNLYDHLRTINDWVRLLENDHLAF